MGHRTDFRNVARDFCQQHNLAPTLRPQLERLLHDAHQCGVVGESCKCSYCNPTKPDAQVMFPWPDDDDLTPPVK